MLCLISHHPFFSLFKEIVSWMYRSRYLKADAAPVRTRILYASEDCNWFLSPRHASTALPYKQSYLSSRADDYTRASVSNLRDYDEKSLNNGVNEQYYQILSQLLRSAARPAPGGILDIRIQRQEFFRYHIQRGRAAHLDDYCFQMLFQCLSLKNVIYVINCLLLEQRVLVHSSHQGLLTPICEALCALLFPFTWEHVFIPFLPVELIEYLQAPVPYFIGLHTNSLTTRIGSEIFASCVVVHLDKDKVVSPIFSRVDDYPVDFSLPRLPSWEVTVLLESLEDVAPNPIGYAPHRQGYGQQKPEVTSHHDPTVNEVELTFGEGPLGITFESTHLRLLAASNFEPGKQLCGSAVVKALPRLRNGLAGPAEQSGLIAAGSYLIAINGQSTLDLTFEETIDYLRRASRPIRLRFLNAMLPYENACQFAERLQALSLVSASQTVHENRFLPWVDTLRGAFAAMFSYIFCDYRKYIDVDRRESYRSGRHHSLPTPEQYGRSRRRSSALAFCVQFDVESFSSAVPAYQKFLREFTQTQCFAGFINETVLGTAASRPRGACDPLELFKKCTHLVRESNNARAAIMRLFERNAAPVETTVLDLPMRQHRHDYPNVSTEKKHAVTDEDDNLERTSAGSTAELMPTESPFSSSPSSSPQEGKERSMGRQHWESQDEDGNLSKQSIFEE